MEFSMNRRMMLGTSMAMAMGPILGRCGGALAAEDSPVPGSAAIPAATPAVASYAEVADEFAASRDAILSQGREIVEQLLGDNAASLHLRLSPELQSAVTEERLAMTRSWLETDRLHFEVSEFGAVF